MHMFGSDGKESACNAGDLGSILGWGLAFSCGSAGKESTYNVGDLSSISGLGRSPGEGLP